MRILVALAGFLVGSAIVSAVALIPLTSSSAGPAAVRSNQMSGMAMSNAMTMKVKAQPVRLTIRHVLHGCHVWSNGKATGAMMRLHLEQGQTLSIMDMDVDAHRMVQFAGPMQMRIGGPMMTNHGMTMTFTKKGIYRFGSKTVEMAGMADVKTIGPDNRLRLVVTVA